MGSDFEAADAAWLDAVAARLRQWLADPAGTAPTSQITGAGAVAAAESRFSAFHRDRPALMVSSATAGLFAALRALGARPGTEVLVPAVDWPGTLGVVLALGAVPVTVPVEPATATMSAAAAAERAGPRTAAAVVCHPLGIPADVAAVRDAIAGVPVVEDCAQALGSTIDGTPVGCLGDLAVFSFGPGKPVDTGEGGMVLARDWDVWEAAARQAAHPVRQLTGGAGQPCLTGLPCRPHPLAAVLLACALQDWEPGERRRRHRLAAESIAAGSPGVEVLGLDGRRRNASLALPVRLSRTDGRCRPACVDAGLFHIDDLLRGAETRPSGIGLVAPQTRTGRGGAR